MNYRKDLILGEAFCIFIFILFSILDFLYSLVCIFIFDDVTVKTQNTCIRVKVYEWKCPKKNCDEYDVRSLSSVHAGGQWEVAFALESLSLLFFKCLCHPEVNLVSPDFVGMMTQTIAFAGDTTASSVQWRTPFSFFFTPAPWVHEGPSTLYPLRQVVFFSSTFFLHRWSVFQGREVRKWQLLIDV